MLVSGGTKNFRRLSTKKIKVTGFKTWSYRRGDPYLFAAASRRRVILSSACPVRREGGVHVASYMLVHAGSGQGGAVYS